MHVTFTALYVRNFHCVIRSDFGLPVLCPATKIVCIGRGIKQGVRKETGKRRGEGQGSDKRVLSRKGSKDQSEGSEKQVPGSEGSEKQVPGSEASEKQVAGSAKNPPGSEKQVWGSEKWRGSEKQDWGSKKRLPASKWLATSDSGKSFIVGLGSC